jgi:hypothetical protein
MSVYDTVCRSEASIPLVRKYPNCPSTDHCVPSKSGPLLPWPLRVNSQSPAENWAFATAAGRIASATTTINLRNIEPPSGKAVA